MIFLYIISLLCVLALFVPSMYLPEIVKWPVCLVVILFITFLFNLPKKDTRYITNDTKRKIVNHGLFNPLILYVSVSLFILGFVIIADYLLANNITDIIGQFSEIVAIFEVSIMNNVLHGLILIVIAILIYFLRYSFKNNASNTGLKLRSFWYINLTIIALLIGVFKFLQFSDIVLFDYLINGYNGYIFLGIIGLVLLIDLIGLLIRVGRAKKALKKQRLAEVEESVSTTVVEETPAVVVEPEDHTPVTTVEVETLDSANDPWSPDNAVMVTTVDKPKKKPGELTDRQKRKVEKIRAKEEKKLAKEEAKIKCQMEKIWGTVKDDEEIVLVETSVTPTTELVAEETPVVVESTPVVEESPVVEEQNVPAEAVDAIPAYEGFVDPLGFVNEDDPWAPNRAKMVAPKRK